MRNGIKFNILGLMRFIILLIIVLLMPLKGFAQNTSNSDVSSQNPMVTIEAKVIQIVLNDEHRQGVDWEAIVSDFHSIQLKKEDDPLWVDKRYKLSVGEVSSEDFAVLLDALDTVGHVSQNDLSLMVLNKNESKTVDVSFDPKILPAIHLDLMWNNSPAGELKLKIDPAVNILLRDNNKSTVGNLKSRTEEDLKDNYTVVIGGLMREEEITKTHKFPLSLLGELPIVGLVFHKQGKLMQKTETIIFLTMHFNSVE
ncbi:MAG: hypothetical protein WCH62_02820 [Candidatus Omnitrophota bacterium]